MRDNCDRLNDCLDSMAYDTWKKELPAHVPGFAERMKQALPDYQMETDSPHVFATLVWSLIYDKPQEIEKVVRTVSSVLANN